MTQSADPGLPETRPFVDRGAVPTKRDVQKALGQRAILWDQMLADLESQFPPLAAKWTYSGKAWGWSLQLKQKKRTVIYLMPCRGYFVAALAMGEQACGNDAVRDLPESVQRVIATASQYPEGRAVRLDVRNRRDLAAVKKLAAIRMAN